MAKITRRDREIVAVVGSAHKAALDAIPEAAPPECVLAVAATLVTTYCVNTGADERDALLSLQRGVDDGLAAHYAKASRGRL